MADDTWLDADWVVVGQQHADGGVVILASSTVREAHLREELHAHAGMGGGIDTTTKATLTVRLGDYTKVRAATYGEAFRLLFGRWPGGSELLAVTTRPDIPWRCEAIMYSGPGHQSRSRCERKDEHGLDDEHWIVQGIAEWRGAEYIENRY